MVNLISALLSVRAWVFQVSLVFHSLPRGCSRSIQGRRSLEEVYQRLTTGVPYGRRFRGGVGMTRRAQQNGGMSAKDLALNRPPGSITTRRKIIKPYGFVCEYLSRWWQIEESEWVQQFEWFRSKAARDNAMHSFENRHVKDWYYCKVRAVKIAEE
jgi:hypothetical protein